MSATPYRMPLPTTSLCQVQRIAGAEFLLAPLFAGRSCSDMYGDLPFGVFVLRDATIRGRAGYIYTSAGEPIWEQNADFLRKKRFLRPRLEEENDSLHDFVECDALVSLLSRCDSTFWHWMMDSLPKVLLAEASGFQGHYLLPPKAEVSWASESMRMMGVSEERLMYRDGRIIRARALSIPTYFCGYNAHHNIPFMRAFRERMRASIAEHKGLPSARIFIGRRDSAKVRRILNHHELETVAADFGFRTVYFEDLSFASQIELACSADAIIGSHGSGLTHSLFMREDSVVVELFPYQRRQSCDCYETLSLITPHRYSALESDRDRDGDIEVDAERLRHVLSMEMPEQTHETL